MEWEEKGGKKEGKRSRKSTGNGGVWGGERIKNYGGKEGGDERG